MFAPAGTSAAIVARLNQEIARVLGQGDVKSKLLTAGVESAPSSPSELAGAIRADTWRLGKVIRDAGIHGD
jgi:tripartite-type tricarboxylate transporter receptor subunit TctC